MSTHFVTTIRRESRRLAGTALTIVSLAFAASASAETFMMPNREMLMGTSEVVWGVTTLDNNGTGGVATTYAFDFNNDGIVDTSGNVTDRSYIAVNFTYVTAGVKTAKLTITRGATVESATVTIRVYDQTDPAVTPSILRGVNVNRAIENGLRYLWASQTSRAFNFPNGQFTSWSGYPRTYTALVVTAFQNQGYTLPNSNAAPTGLYERFIVQRGLNYVFDQLRQHTLTTQTNLNPCVGAGIEASPCIGLQADADSGQAGYSTAIASLPIAVANAPLRTVAAGIGANNANFVAGKTYREVLQRVVNAIVFNQSDSGTARGGWSYTPANNAANTSDGSVIGWDVLALLDGAAAGATIPAAVMTEFRDFALVRHLNTDGSFDYTADGNPAGSDFVGKNPAKAGIGLQGLFWVGEHGDSFPRVQASRNFLNAWWQAPQAGAGYACVNGAYNKGCAYAMFNVFKALKLHGITTLPNVNRPAGSVGGVDDWYEDYVDWLLANQQAPTNSGGGHWSTMSFSSITSNTDAQTAIAELILAPVALIPPDETKFSTIGLQPPTASRTINTTHTVTGKAESAGGSGIPGVTMTIKILTGPNAGEETTGTTDGNGELKFTYPGDEGVGQDTLQAYIGQLASNQVTVNWVVGTTACDADGNKKVENADLMLIRAAMGKPKSGATDPRDGNGDGAINIADLRFCQLKLGTVYP